MNLTFAVNVTLNLSINKKYYKLAFNRKLSTNFLVTDTKFSLKNLFFFSLFHSTFGEIKTLRLPQKLSGSGTHRGFAFVDFLTKQGAKVRGLYYVTI